MKRRFGWSERRWWYRRARSLLTDHRGSYILAFPWQCLKGVEHFSTAGETFESNILRSEAPFLPILFLLLPTRSTSSQNSNSRSRDIIISGLRPVTNNVETHCIASAQNRTWLDLLKQVPSLCVRWNHLRSTHPRARRNQFVRVTTHHWFYLGAIMIPEQIGYYKLVTAFSKLKLQILGWFNYAHSSTSPRFKVGTKRMPSIVFNFSPKQSGRLIRTFSQSITEKQQSK